VVRVARHVVVARVGKLIGIKLRNGRGRSIATPITIVDEGGMALINGGVWEFVKIVKIKTMLWAMTCEI